MPSAFLDQLRAVVGEAHVIVDEAAMQPALTELRGLHRGHALAVIRPGSTAEVSRVMQLADTAGIPVVAQGGNTGLVGGGVPFGGIVLSLARLKAIRAVDPVNATMIVEAGVVLQAVQEAAQVAGMLFPLSLASEGSCTIGGNIATNAGGTAVLRYGNTRDLILGLEVVLPNGEIWNGLSGLRKDNAGYDLKHLFIGSEGTLGIVTAAVVKLFPAPQSRATAFLAAPDPDAVVKLFHRLRGRAGERLTTFEILPRFGLDVVLRHAPNVRDPFAAAYPFYALVELTSPEVEAGLEPLLLETLEAGMEAGEVLDATLAASAAQAADFWRLREQLSECQRHEGGSIKHDVSVPISRVADFLTETSAACEAAMPGIRVCAFGHIGDGNIHFNLSQPLGMDKTAFLGTWHRFNRLVHDAVAARGGSIAAEHGVGLIKRDELPQYKDPVALALMATLKRALDPKNLLNPGKVIALGNDLPAFTPGRPAA
ncbi:FAD-binding oxidoreductase [Rhabdaerophilum sp. SD176]|uniref:FAD-binding oxidoreductase n=1 Tax=Rhabdaerophilum sp. SD176 TaxID=2983548 RepID=UPI0024DF6BE5|nr:FAD-binding oxidoreductase [Rhabdaerophilum sp. SD176]